MGPASGAHRGRAAAEQTPLARQPQRGAFHLLSVWPQHIHIKQPPQGGILFQRCRQGLHRQRLRRNHQQQLTAGGFVHQFGMNHRHSRHRQLLRQRPPPQIKAPADQGRAFDGSRDVHRKADQGLPIIIQQLPLPQCPLLPGLQHFHQGDFHVILLFGKSKVVQDTFPDKAINWNLAGRFALHSCPPHL